MAPDLAQIGMPLMFIGSIAVFAWVKPALHLTQEVLSLLSTAASSLFDKKGTRA